MNKFSKLLTTLYECFICNFCDYLYYSNEVSMQDLNANMDLNSQIMIMENSNSTILAQESALNILSAIHETHSIIKQENENFDFSIVALSNPEILETIAQHMTIRAGWPEDVVEEELEDFIDDSQLEFLEQTMKGQIVEFPYLIPDFFNDDNFL